MSNYTEEAAQLRALAAECRRLAETASDPDAAKSLRAIADEIETLILRVIEENSYSEHYWTAARRVSS